jgi:hypothetical protein
MGYIPNMKQLAVAGAVGFAALTPWGAAAQQARDAQYNADAARCQQVFNASRRDDNALLDRSSCLSRAGTAYAQRVGAAAQRRIDAANGRIDAANGRIDANQQQIDRNRLEAACVREVTRAVQEGIVTRERVAAYIAGRDLDTVGRCNLRNAVLPRAPAGQQRSGPDNRAPGG